MEFRKIVREVVEWIQLTHSMLLDQLSNNQIFKIVRAHVEWDGKMVISSKDLERGCRGLFEGTGI